MTRDPPDGAWFDDIQAWVDGVLDLAREGLGDLPPALSQIEGRFLDHLDRAAMAGGWRQLSGNIDLFPLLPLQAWLAGALGVADDPRVRTVAAASWLGYCAVRITDDAMDEPSVATAERLLLAELHLLRFVAMLRDAIPDDGAFWRRFHDRWSRYSDATAAARTRTPETWQEPTAEEIREVGERFAPAAIPLEAIARLGGHDELIGDLDAVVLHLGISVQLMNDLVGLEGDVRAGRWSTAAALVLGGEGRGVDIDSSAFWRRALHRPGIQPLLERALDEQRVAGECLLRILPGSRGLDEYLRARETWIGGYSAAMIRQGLAFRAREVDRRDGPSPGDGIR